MRHAKAHVHCFNTLIIDLSLSITCLSDSALEDKVHLMDNSDSSVESARGSDQADESWQRSSCSTGRAGITRSGSK